MREYLTNLELEKMASRSNHTATNFRPQRH